ncbi:MAG: hypothetical protein C4563_11310 [Desulfobulbus sp.]|nr:MAG: hypothetical protein C4563_11310 [Desulfobulbus sp.]
MRKLCIWLSAVVVALFVFQSPTGAAQGPGRIDVPLIAGQQYEAGMVTIHNNNGGLLIDVQIAEGWRMTELHVHAGWEGNPIPMKNGNAVPGKFDFKYEYKEPAVEEPIWLDFVDDLQGFRWGEPYEPQRLRHIAVHANVIQVDEYGRIIAEQGAWAQGDIPFEGGQWGWWLQYMMAHKARAHFVDSPVQGVRAVTPTGDVLTDEAGGFDYFPGEWVALYLGQYLLGSAIADHRVTLLDLFESSDTDDQEVINMARLLQSLDSDGFAKSGIQISPDIVSIFEAVMADKGFVYLNCYDNIQIDEIISEVVARASIVYPLMEVVSADEAKDHLEEQLNSAMFRKNISKTPEMATAKSKVDLMPVLVPATRANGEPYDDPDTAAVGVDYYDEDGNYLYTRDNVKPLVAVYADQNPDSPTGAMDVFGAVSRDDGNTWKRMNLSRAADRSSFTLANGLPYYGDVKKPNLSIKGNYILAVWQSKFCRGGQPRYSRGEFLEDGVTPNPYYVDDIWGVGGPQRSRDYTEDGFPEVGELPYYCLWACRGVITLGDDPATTDVNEAGEIKWRKPERLTSGRRDVWQVAVNGAKGVGFGIVWQEDPEGVRPGEMAGPGHGWSGATTNHKTDIWYSFIKWSDFATIDGDFSPSGDPAHAFDDPEWTSNRPMWAVPMSLPMRLSDNDTCNTDNMKVELGTDGFPKEDADGNWIPINDPEDPEWDGKHAGTHRYAYLIDDNANGTPDLCAAFYTFVNEQGETKNVCITEDLSPGDNIDDRRLLDGDTGASRPNISFMPYTRTDGTQSAWVAVVYEETKGVGGGAPDHTGESPYGGEDVKPDSGKNVIYHSFDFGFPNKVSGGDIVNLPARDMEGNLLYLIDYETGARVLDWTGQPQLAYENARRPRMLVQPPGQAGASGTVMVMVYKQGEEGKGRPSDIFMRRVNKKLHTGNPYAFWNFVCKETRLAENGRPVCVDGVQNLSSVTPLEYWYNPNLDDQAKGEGVKVVKYEQYEANLSDASWTNPYEDARAHRGILRGDNVFFAYDYTPNWAASRNAHDKYDLFIRRSFDGGQTWTTDPEPIEPDGVGDTFDNTQVCQTRIWKDYTTILSEDDANKRETYEEVVCFAPGVFEPSRNMSLLKNNKLSVIEPRLVGPSPGAIPGSTYPEDIYDSAVYYATFGTATNVPKAHGDDEEYEETAVPADLYYTFTRDRGQTYFKRLWDVNPDSAGNWAGQIVERYDYLAKDDPEQGEAQIRMTPDGSRFYAVWNQEGEEGSDTWFRRIMSADFPQNVAAPEEP